MDYIDCWNYIRTKHALKSHPVYKRSPVFLYGRTDIENYVMKDTHYSIMDCFGFEYAES